MCGRRPRRSRRRGWSPLTQFGRMCAALQIQIIPASSPQAKGRIERNHGTHQDRLVKKLRRLGVVDDAAANAFSSVEYWTAHNARFAQSPAAAARLPSAVPRPRGCWIACFGSKRRGRSATIGSCGITIARCNSPGRVATRRPAARVTVCEWPDGRLEIEYRGRPMPGPRSPATSRPRRVPRPRRRRPRSARPADALTREIARRDHPWRQSPYKDMRTPRAAEAGVTTTDLKGTFLSS